MGLFDVFKKGLAKTRDKIASGLRSVLAVGRKIDESLLEELADAMLAGDMGPSTVMALQDEVRGAWKAGEISEAQEILPFLKRRIAATWSADDRQLRLAASGPTVIFVVGINGSGKTTSVAKLGSYLRKQGKSVLLGACDTFRAAAIEQLAIWAERCGAQIVKHQSGSDAAAVAFDACEAAVARNMDALVLDATIGQNAINQAKVFSEVTKVTGLFLAKLDGSAKGGIVVGIRDQLDIPVKFVGLGETIDDIEPFDPDAFVEALFADQ